MTPERFRRVREVFEEALDVEPANLHGWLDARIGEDPEVRREVEALLRVNSRAGSFLSADIAGRRSDLLAEEPALEPGDRIGRYIIEREIGRGGMGHVYLAQDPDIGRRVALKALAPHLVRDEAHRERLRREARAAGALSHPGICTIFKLEEQDGDVFIVSEYVEGKTLREEIASGRPPSPNVVRETARELAAALASAHAKGITHRDLKPENVMRTHDGRIKVLDFGLARFDPAIDQTPARVTQPGMLIGTPAYMAPEQLSGEAVDARADVFAFGVLMYEYACGVHPFEASTALGVAARAMAGDLTPLTERCPALPASLAAVIHRSLQRSPAARFASAAEILSALERDEAPAPPRSLVTAWWRRHQVAAIGLCLVASALAWQIKEWEHAFADTLFLIIGVAATIAGVFRSFLIFNEQMNPAGFDAELGRARPVLLAADLVIALALATDGVLTSRARPLAGVLTIALAVTIALVSAIVEPATTRAAFERKAS